MSYQGCKRAENLRSLPPYTHRDIKHKLTYIIPESHFMHSTALHVSHHHPAKTINHGPKVQLAALYYMCLNHIFPYDTG